MNKHSNRSKASNAYVGRIDPRSCHREDYKWFQRQNVLGSASKYNKLKLNLFIDASGSFCGNVRKVQELLDALAILENRNPNFTFDFITMNDKNVLHEKTDRILRTAGSNNLNDSIVPIWKKVQTPNSDIYNIVLFDGCAVNSARPSNEWCAAHSHDEITQETIKIMVGQYFSTFDHQNCTVISNRSNRSYMEKYCPTAKCIISDSYTKELVTNVLTTIARMLA